MELSNWKKIKNMNQGVFLNSNFVLHISNKFFLIFLENTSSQKKFKMLQGRGQKWFFYPKVSPVLHGGDEESHQLQKEDLPQERCNYLQINF